MKRRPFSRTANEAPFAIRERPEEHRLRPLLAPRSIALVGGSPREGSVGNLMIKSLVRGGFRGDLNVVNPKYDSVEGLAAFPSLHDLPEPPDLAVISVASRRMEALMREAIEAGARAAVVFDFCRYQDDREPMLLERLRDMAREADFPVCGGNGMGYFNYETRTFVSFASPVATMSGHIAALCHSGSVFCMLADAAGRYRFNFLTSQGQEISASLGEYMDYALVLPSTRVLALFVEAIREPEVFVAALEKARQRGVPVVAVKVGRTAESARLAATHASALTGDDSAFDAVCRRYGVLRTDDVDSLMAAAQIFALGKEIGEGHFAAVLDSGGLRTQMMDLADAIGVEFAPLAPETVEALSARLDYGLQPANPLDAAGAYDEDHGVVIGDCLEVLERDPGVAIVAHEYYASDVTPGLPEIGAAAKRMPEVSPKPYVLSYSLGPVTNAEFANEMMEFGVPVINGVRPLLAGVKCAFDYRDYRKRADSPPEVLDGDRVERWRSRLRNGAAPSESEILQMLGELGMSTVESRVCGSAREAVLAADSIGYPVAIKTAVPGLMHKSDTGGVYLDLETESQVRAAYEALLTLGSEVSVAGMAPAGVEIAFGMVRDAQFGPVVMTSAGGTLVEVLDDRVHALAPFGRPEAKRLLEGLKIWKLLCGVRGRAPADVDRLAMLLSRFSVICHALGEVVAEMDINPIIASESAVLAVDAALVPASEPR